MTDAIGFLSLFLAVAGTVFLAQKRRPGWIVSIAATVFWGIYGVQIASKPIILNAAAFFCINVYRFLHWRREELAALATAKVDQRRKYEKWFEEQRRSA